MRFIIGLAEQLVLFPVSRVQCTPERFFRGLPGLVRQSHAGVCVATVWCNSGEIDEFLIRAIIFGARIDSHHVASFIRKAFTASEGTGKCMVCGRPSQAFRSCSCGTYEWCMRCEEGGAMVFWSRFGAEAPLSTIFWDHADHDCTPECCTRGHTLQNVSPSELEAMVPRYESVIRDARSEEAGVFTVTVRRKTAGERAEERALLLESYCVKR